MSKNICSGCNTNFNSMATFDAHRVFDVPNDWSTRRCLTPQEMQAKGWNYSEPAITFHNNGKSFKRATPTWEKPLTEKQKASLQKLSKKNRIG